MQISRYLLASLLLLFLVGCEEDFPTYSKFCQDKNTSMNCLNYIGIVKKDKKLIQDRLKIKENKSCPYKVYLTKYHVKECNNPIVKSTGSDFDGYVRIEVKKGFNCYYKIQSDYKDDMDAAFERVLKKMQVEFSS